MQTAKTGQVGAILMNFGLYVDDVGSHREKTLSYIIHLTGQNMSVREHVFPLDPQTARPTTRPIGLHFADRCWLPCSIAEWCFGQGLHLLRLNLMLVFLQTILAAQYLFPTQLLSCSRCTASGTLGCSRSPP